MNKNLEILYELTEEFMNSLFLKAEEIYLYENLSEEFDLGLRSMLGINRSQTLSEFTGIDFNNEKERIIYYLQDEYACSYILLPHNKAEDLMVLIGPYITKVLEISEIRKMFRSQRITNEQIILLLQYYGSLPCITDEGILHSYIEVLAHFVQGDDADIRKMDIAVTSPEFGTAVKQDHSIRLKNLEKKYQNETVMMERIANGDETGARKAVARINRFTFDVRSSDTIRSQQYLQKSGTTRKCTSILPG